MRSLFICIACLIFLTGCGRRQQEAFQDRECHEGFATNIVTTPYMQEAGVFQVEILLKREGPWGFDEITALTARQLQKGQEVRVCRASGDSVQKFIVFPVVAQK